jgi:hypothetical protein
MVKLMAKRFPHLMEKLMVKQMAKQMGKHLILLMEKRMDCNLRMGCS